MTSSKFLAAVSMKPQTGHEYLGQKVQPLGLNMSMSIHICGYAHMRVYSVCVYMYICTCV